VIDRTKYRWKAALQIEDGETREVGLDTYWSPHKTDKDGNPLCTEQDIAIAAAAYAYVASGKVKRIAGVAARYVGEVLSNGTLVSPDGELHPA
jgi:hypothetical protein